jgi:hypothetical protein
MAFGERKHAEEAGMPVEEFRLRQQAKLRGRPYEELREEVARSTVEAARRRPRSVAPP